MVMNIPFLMCERCGQGLPKAIIEDTMTHREMHEVQKPKVTPKSWREKRRKIIEDAFEKKYGDEVNPRR